VDTKAGIMPPKTIERFISGLITRRNPLYPPFKALNILGGGTSFTKFDDVLCDGLNIECSDLFTLQRRPGFSEYCSASLSAGEIVNQFYSFRDLNGTLFTLADTNQRLAKITPTAVTSILTKTVATQGFISPVGNMLYFADGKDALKYDTVLGIQSAWGLAAPTTTPSITGVGMWLPKTTFASGQAILDPNGNVEIVFGSASGATSQVGTATTQSTVALAGAYTANGASWVSTGPPPDVFSYTIGVTPNYGNYIFLESFGLSIPAGAIILGLEVAIYKASFVYGQISDQSVRLVVGGNVVGSEHASSASWNPLSLVPTLYGAPNDTWGVSLTPAQLNASGSGGFGFVISPSAVVSGDYAYVGVAGPWSAKVTVYYQVSTPSVTGQSGLSQPIWPAQILNTVNDGSLQWLNAGPILTWYAGVYYPTPAIILDTNGNLQYAPGVDNAAVAWASGTGYVVGNIAFYGGSYWICTHNNTGIAPTMNYSVATLAGAVTTSIQYWSPAASPLATALSAPVWNTVVGGTTVDGSYTWTNLGQGSNIALAGYSYVYAFRTTYGHLTTSSPVSQDTGPILGPLQSPITAFSISSNVVKFTGANNFIAGNTFTVVGMGIGTYLNGQTFVVNATGLTPAVFYANLAHPDALATPDTGQAVPLIATISSIGTASPLCNATAPISAVAVSANLVTITAPNNFTQGLFVTHSGLTTATFLNGIQMQVQSVDGLPSGVFANSSFTAIYVTPNYNRASDTGTAEFNAVEIYRLADGGGIWYFDAAVTNPGASGIWTFNDFTADMNLTTQLFAPINHQNDPPPGQPGSLILSAGSILAWWQGRHWMVVGNKLYFDGGPDVLNGIAEESWPPANVFVYPGAINGVWVSSEGILVYTSDQLYAVCGGPQTLSFYSGKVLDKFGVSSPNCIALDGAEASVFTTQAQHFLMSTAGKDEVGQRIGDVFLNEFPPDASYTTVHRNGLDSGIFVSNGTDTIVRYGINTQNWSTIYTPVMGVGALSSVETGIGQYSLLLAPTTAAGKIYFRDINSFSDAGTGYDAFATVGSITLSEPGQPLVPLCHIIGYFGAPTGFAPPTVSMLPNEIAAVPGAQFIILPEAVPEPPIGTDPSVSLSQLRWLVNMNLQSKSLMMHHVQVKIDFGAQKVLNEVLAVSLKFEMQN